MREHEPNCPRLQFWDAGEWDAPCLCEDRKSPPWWLGPVVLGIILGAVLLIWAWAATEADGQGAKRGAGYITPPGSIAVWRCGPTRRIPINTKAEPWHPDGSRKVGQWSQIMADRYCGGDTELCRSQCPQGAYAEHVDWNKEALRNACEAGALAPGYDCNPHPMEESDLAYLEPRCGSFYLRWRHQERVGGTPENPVVVDRQGYESFYARTMEINNVCSLGLHSIGGQFAVCGWNRWYDVQYLPPEPPWCSTEEPDPDPPPPPPPPEPEPEPDPGPPPVQTCQPGEECRPPCPECPDFPEECSELADLTEIHARQLETVRGLVAAECVAALPDGTWRQVDDGRFCKAAPAWLLDQVAKTERLLLEAREECLGAERRFVPGTPSTGRLDVELTERSEGR